MNSLVLLQLTVLIVSIGLEQVSAFWLPQGLTGERSSGWSFFNPLTTRQTPSTNETFTRDKLRDFTHLMLSVNGSVVDVTTWISQHPGGFLPLLQSLGADATDKFNSVGHSDYAKGILKSFTVGQLV